MLIIGEKINASIKSVGQAISNRDQEFLAGLARSQAEAGADFVDVNAGVGRDSRQNATAIMEWLIDIVQDATGKPLCIDSDDPSVLKVALDRYRGEKVMINSVNADPERLDTVGRLAAQRHASLVALVTKDTGIPKTAKERLDAAEMIIKHLERVGVKRDQIYFDPLVLPIAVDSSQGLVTIKTIEQIKSLYPSAKTILGLSNISYGLPNRGMINQSFMLMAASAGLDAAIMNPLDTKLMGMVKVADMLTDKDPLCKGFLRAHRKGLLSD